VALVTSSRLKALNFSTAISLADLTSSGIVNQNSCKDRTPLRTVSPSKQILGMGANNNLLCNRIFDGKVSSADTVTRTSIDPDGEIIEISPKLFPTADQYLPSTTM
jgi:hypothetical protein